MADPEEGPLLTRAAPVVPALPDRSFRDPSGYVLRAGGRILRVIEGKAIADFEAFLATSTARDFITAGKLIGTKLVESRRATPGANIAYSTSVSDLDTVQNVYEHERVEFPSYPYEWPSPMLHSAGCLTLDIARGALKEGFGLKDATPYNILFRGPRPVFVDVSSFERRRPGDERWLPYAQFLRTFLLPLALVRATGLRLDDVLLNRRDGVEPEELYRALDWRRRLSRPYFSLASMPTWLAGSRRSHNAAMYASAPDGDPERALFVLTHLLRHAQKTLDRVRPKARQSDWTDYATQNSYAPAQAEAKRRFVEAALADFGSARVLDVGCNTGQFSVMTARMGAAVVAIDSDPEVVGALWQHAAESGLNILPLVVNLARPSPAVGWRYTECESFLSRAEQHFDAVLMLAVLHHLIVSERVPLSEVIAVAAQMTKAIAIIEFVGPSDPMFRLIARGRDALHEGLTPESFECACREHFEIVRSERLPGAERWMYLLKKAAQ